MANKQDLPLDIPNLGRWLAQDPEERLPLLQAAVLEANEKESARVAERVRIALKIAWDVRPERVFAVTASWVSSPDPRLRALVAGALPLSNSEAFPDAFKLIRKLADDPDPIVRQQAVDQVLEEINDHLDLAARWIKDPDPQIRAIVARRLRHLATDQIKPQIELFHPLAADPHPDVAWATASTLAELYERENRPVIETMRIMATSPHETTRAAAAACFFEHAFADNFDQLLPTMRAWLRTATEDLRWTLSRSLRFIEVTPRTMQLIRALYEDPDPKIRARLVQSLIDLFNPLKESRHMLVPLLVRAQEDQHKQVRDAVEAGHEVHGPDFAASLSLVSAATAPTA